jgi:hypothetical protein
MHTVTTGARPSSQSDRVATEPGVQVDSSVVFLAVVWPVSELLVLLDSLVVSGQRWLPLDVLAAS